MKELIVKIELTDEVKEFIQNKVDETFDKIKDVLSIKEKLESHLKAVEKQFVLTSRYGKQDKKESASNKNCTANYCVNNKQGICTIEEIRFMSVNMENGDTVYCSEYKFDINKQKKCSLYQCVLNKKTGYCDLKKAKEIYGATNMVCYKNKSILNIG